MTHVSRVSRAPWCARFCEVTPVIIVMLGYIMIMHMHRFQPVNRDSLRSGGAAGVALRCRRHDGHADRRPACAGCCRLRGLGSEEPPPARFGRSGRRLVPEQLRPSSRVLEDAADYFLLAAVGLRAIKLRNDAFHCR